MLLLLSRLQIFFLCQYLTTILQNDSGICQALSIQKLSTKINLEIKLFTKRYQSIPTLTILSKKLIALQMSDLKNSRSYKRNDFVIWSKTWGIIYIKVIL